MRRYSWPPDGSGSDLGCSHSLRGAFSVGCRNLVVSLDPCSLLPTLTDDEGSGRRRVTPPGEWRARILTAMPGERMVVQDERTPNSRTGPHAGAAAPQ